jgi:2-methylcitrate dehydratase
MELDAPTRSVVDFVRSAEFKAMSDANIHCVVRNYLDSVGCAAAGFDGEATAIARGIAEPTSGSPSVTVFGLPNPAMIEYAVFANAIATRYCDWNDGGLNAAHPSDMAPAIVAMAESINASGADLVSALWVAYEVLGAFGSAVRIRDKKWDQGFFISLGVAAGLSYLLQLNEEQIANAISMAITPSVPMRISRTGELSHWKAAASAHASTTATLAVRLAQAGMTGPYRVFDGVEGVFEKVTGEFDLGVIGPREGKVSVPERVAHKYFPCFMESQGPVFSMLKLRGQFSVDEIKAIKLTTFYLAWHEGGGGQDDHAEKWNPQTKETADHSLPYTMARAFMSGPLNIDSFSPEMVREASLRPLMDKITVVEDTELSARRKSHHEETSIVTVELIDGRTFEETTMFPRGSVKNPMTDDELSEKFDGSIKKVLADGGRNELRERLWNLPNEDDLQNITALYRRFSTGSRA